jgi:tetratricopeptide (TPR) repeat protein
MRRSGNRRCVVVFSSFAARDYGHLAFSYRNHFQAHHPDVDLIFVKDAANQWYNHGLRDLGTNLHENIARLRELTANYDHLTTFGSSMGGYASILYGNALGAQHVVALSPQTLLRPPFPRYNPKIHRGEYADLDKQAFQGHACVDVFVGEDELFDIYQAARLKAAWGDAVHLTVVPNVAHNVVKLFDDEGTFRQLVQRLCGDVGVDPLAQIKAKYADASFVSSRLREVRFVHLLNQAVEAFYRDRAMALAPFQALLECAPAWLGARAKLGLIQYACGQLTDALETFTGVANRSTTIDEIHEAYAATAVKSGNADRAVEIATKCARIDAANKGVLLSTATLLESMGLSDHAQDCRDRWARLK